MSKEDKNALKQQLIDWIQAIESEKLLRQVNEVREAYETGRPLNENDLDRIEDMLEKSERDMAAGRVVSEQGLNAKIDQWLEEASK